MRKQIVATVFLKRGNKLLSCWNTFLKSWPQHIYVMCEIKLKTLQNAKTLFLTPHYSYITLLLLQFCWCTTMGSNTLDIDNNDWTDWLLAKREQCQQSFEPCTMCTVSVKESLNDWIHWSYAQRQMTPIYSESKLTEQEKKQCKENRASE